MSRLYTQAKVFHFHEKLDAMQAGRPAAPLHVRLKPTNRCNHNCNYCCYRASNLFVSELMNERDEIPREKMRQVVCDLAEMGVRAVTFSGGGEPLIYPHFVETVEGLLAAGIKVAALTNGSVLKGAAAEVLGRGATWVRISMDAADGETYARIRGVGPKEFDKVCDNIAAFAAAKSDRCELGINFIVIRENHKDVTRFLERVKPLGVNHVKVSEAVVATTVEGNRRYLAPMLSQIKQQLADAAGRLADERFAVIDKVHDFSQPTDQYNKTYSRCPFIQWVTIIAADQNVYTCHDKAYTASGRLGSIRDGSFRELWFSEAVRDRLSGLDPRDQCRHHCAEHTKNLMLLDYLGADPDHLEFV